MKLNNIAAAILAAITALGFTACSHTSEKDLANATRLGAYAPSARNHPDGNAPVLKKSTVIIAGGVEGTACNPQRSYSNWQVITPSDTEETRANWGTAGGFARDLGVGAGTAATGYGWVRIGEKYKPTRIGVNNSSRSSSSAQQSQSQNQTGSNEINVSDGYYYSEGY